MQEYSVYQFVFLGEDRLKEVYLAQGDIEHALHGVRLPIRRPAWLVSCAWGNQTCACRKEYKIFEPRHDQPMSCRPI